MRERRPRSPGVRWYRVARLVLRHRYGSAAWDALLRATGASAAVGIPITVFVPAATPLIGFLLVTVWVNNPVAFLLPGVYEPIVVAFGTAYPPVLVAGAGVAGTLAAEYGNYRVYQHLYGIDRFARLRRGRVSRWVERRFRRAPFFTIWICSILLPYWPVRIVSPLAGYSLRRHLLATALGRWPRLWLLALVGAGWRIERWPVTIAAVTLAVALVLGARRQLTRRYVARTKSVPVGAEVGPECEEAP